MYGDYKYVCTKCNPYTLFKDLYALKQHERDKHGVKMNDAGFFEDIEIIIKDDLNEFINRLVTGQSYSSELDLELKFLAEQIYCKKDQDFLFSAIASRAVLLPHQLGAVRKAIRETAKGILLADAVGLGKTIEAGMIIKEFIIRGAQRVLILVPAHLLSKWHDELKFKLGLNFEVYTSEDIKERLGWHNRIICSIHTAKRPENLEYLRKFNWDLVIIDEAHHLRNPPTRAYRLGLTLVRNSKPYVILLTATPLQNNISELYTILSLIDDRFFGFIHSRENALTFMSYDMIRRLLQNVMVRNTRKDLQYLLHYEIINKLPNSNEIKSLLGYVRCEREVKTILVKLGDRWMDIYERVTSYCKELYKRNPYAAIFVTMLAQRMVCSSITAINDFFRRRHIRLNEILERQVIIEMTEEFQAEMPNSLGYEKVILLHDKEDEGEVSEKDAALIEIIDKELDPNEKILIFTEFKGTQRHLINILKRRYNENIYFLNGDLSEKEKRGNVELWKENGRIMVSTDVGAEGLDMQFCGVVINYDLPWNPMKIEQRIGRIHRIGQTRERVRIFNLCAKETIEEYVLETLHNKIGIFEKVVGDIENILGQIWEKRQGRKDYPKLEQMIAEIILQSKSREELASRLEMNIGRRIEEVRREAESSLNEIDRRVWGDLDLSVVKAILQEDYFTALINKISEEEKTIESFIRLHLERNGEKYEFKEGILHYDGRRLSCRRNLMYEFDVELISLSSQLLLDALNSYINKVMYCKISIGADDQREDYLKEIIRHRKGKSCFFALLKSTLRINYLDRIHIYEKVTPYVLDIDTCTYDKELSDNFFRIKKRDLPKNCPFPHINVENIQSNLLALLNKDIKEKLYQVADYYRHRFEFDKQTYEELIPRKFNHKIDKLKSRLKLLEKWLEALQEGRFPGGPEELADISPRIKRLFSRKGVPRIEDIRREDILLYIKLLEKDIVKVKDKINQLNQRVNQELTDLRAKLEKVKRPEVDIAICAVALIKIES
ncbi:RNA polymerase-associated protein RapA [Candidatus Calditenuaceae archaeon HR02]|nr:RNA polymerase-associated protein RapA [Candidatus Calditenuaceae archaeon HR02]